MTGTPNAVRGEAALMVGGATIMLRPTFAALVAAEQELGPLFVLVERAAEGRLGIGEMTGLFFHCAADRPDEVTRERIGQAIAESGLAKMAPVLRVLLTQILQGRV